AYGVSADEARALEAELRVEHMRTDSRRRRSEETIRTRSGETRTWLVHGSYVRRASDDRGLMVTMGLDISERREAEAAMRDLARFPDEDPNPVLRIGAGGELLYANPAARTVLQECEHADGGNPPVAWRRLAREAREEGVVRRAEVQCSDRTFAMSFVPISEAGYTNVYALDISLRKRAEDALMQARADLERQVDERTRELSAANRRLRAAVDELSEARDGLRESSAVLESVFDNTHMLIAYMDRDFNFIRVNRAYAAADEATPDALVGKNHFDLYPNLENEEIFRQVVETGRPYYAFARAFAYADNPERGQTYWDWSLQPVIDDAGEVEGLILCLVDVTERRRATLELERSREQLRALTARSVELVEEERLRMAREVHDGLGQELTALQTALGVLRRKAAQADGPLDTNLVIERIDRMLADAETTVGTVRDISRRLRPAALDELGLAAAIEEEAEAFEQRTGIDCRVHLPPTPGPLGAEQSTAMFRILREALANVERHADADAADISLAWRGGTVALTVADDGVGITPEEEASPTSLGLLGMKERAFRLGGNVIVRGAPGDGTTVTVVLPIDGEEQEP
ncbi:MAG: PAS domain-containing protein, partial [Planctomycetota bacterium]